MRVLLLLSLFAVPSLQQDPAVVLQTTFKALDTNANGFLSQAEVQAYAATFDPNNDCDVTYAEWTSQADADQVNSPELRGPFNYYDSIDGRVDNKITCDDVIQIFQMIDVNHDDKVPLAEFVAQYPKIQAGIQAQIDNLQGGVGK